MNISDQRKRLFLLLALLLIIGFLSSSLLSYQVARNAVRDTIINRELPLTGDSIYSEIQRDILRPVFVSQQMAQNTFLRDWAISGERDVDSLTRYLAEIKASQGAITSFFISEKTRFYYVPAGVLKTVKESEAADAWYFRVRQMKEAYEINSDPDAANKNILTVFINHKVFDYGGNYLGVTGIGLSSNSLERLVDQYEKKFGRRISFVDAKGQIIMTSKLAAVEQGMLSAQPGMQAVAEQIINRSAEQTKLQYEREGRTVHVNSRLIPELNWYLLVEEEESRALAPLTRVLWATIAIGIIATLSALALVLFAVRRYQQHLEHMASTDMLSSLTNRQTGEAKFSAAVNEAASEGALLSLIVFDIDHFKRINDNYGHLTGDHVIAQVARQARQLVGHKDMLVRWGGEEFVILLPEYTLDEARKLAVQLLAQIELLRLKLEGAHREGQAAHAEELQLTVSAGVAQHEKAELPEAFFSRADAALYRAKQAGRNCVELG
jgi:diguanylate cyclase (GGDEF)-like protein